MARKRSEAAVRQKKAVSTRKRDEAVAAKAASKRMTPAQAERKVEELIEHPKAGSVLDRSIPAIRHGFGEVTEIVFKLDDPEGELEILINALRIDEPLEQGVLEQALNDAQDYARRAHRLFVLAKVENAAFGIDCAEVDAAIRDAAKAALEQEKKDGKRSKQITDADIVAEMAQSFPDAWATIQSRRERAKRMVDHLQRLADLWQQRCHDVRALLGKRG
jgi:hypothetical protein